MRRAPGLIAALLVPVALLLCGAAVLGVTWSDVAHFGTPHNVVIEGGVEHRVPAPLGDGSRLLPEVPVTTAGEYVFTHVDDGEPVRFDPCEPVRWVLNSEGAPTGADELVHEAVVEVQARTGLLFEYEGSSDETVSLDRDLFQQRYGEGALAPLLIGWTSAEAEPELGGTVLGVGGSSALSGAYGDDRYLVSGVVALDAPDAAVLLGSLSGADVLRAVIMHELGHVVGLGHVDDAHELMHESNRWRTAWGDGDLAGLALAGAGACQSG